MSPLERVTGLLPGVKRKGNQWLANCPAHDDRTPSLSISQGDDGRVLLHCHAGCRVEDICSSLGIETSALFEKLEQRAGDSFRGAVAKSDLTPESLIDSLGGKCGVPSGRWDYHDADGRLMGVVVRFQPTADQKTYRPLHRSDQGWQVGSMPHPRPLYRLPELLGADYAFVCEGEKAAEAVRELGLLATTSAGGSSAAPQADWQPLSGKFVIILPDNDDVGEAYADAVREQLRKVTPPATVLRVDLTDVPPKGDAFDFVQRRRQERFSDSQIKVELLKLVHEAYELEVAQSRRYVPFPVHTLPAAICSVVEQGAEAIGCDPSYIALPALAVLAASIGTTRRIQVKPGWTAKAILWTAIVGESGTAKTPAFRLATSPLKKRQAENYQECQSFQAEYERDCMRYEKDLARWKKASETGDPPVVPVEPKVRRHLAADATVEAMTALLADNPRGVLLQCDELATWFASFNRYRTGGGGGDSAYWLSCYTGESISVDRRTGTRSLFVPEAAVSVSGGIQPGILQRQLTTEHRESGLAARLLMAWPPRRQRFWTESTLSPHLTARYERVVGRLLDLQPIQDSNGAFQAVCIHMSPEANALFRAFYDRNSSEMVALSSDLSAAWSKLEEIPARLALIFALVDQAEVGSTTLQIEVDADTMRKAIELTEWFKYETARIYDFLDKSGQVAKQQRLCDWIRERGGEVAVREVQQKHAGLKAPNLARNELQSLVDQGWGEWVEPEKGKAGRPTQRFRLRERRKLPDALSFVDCVDVEPNFGEEDAWGTV